MGQGIKILIVDDEPPLLKMMSVYLTRLGYSVTVAETTDKALEIASTPEANFAAAVLDATMAGLSMEELASRMLREHAMLRVIATSGYPVDMTALESAAPGRAMFLPKPFTPEMLAKAVRRMLAAPEEAV